MAEQGIETGPGGLRLADFIRQRQQAILRAWERRARELPAAESLPGSALRDHIPDILERISRILQGLQRGEQDLLQELTGRHALERLNEGYSLRMAAEELRALRDAVLELWEREVAGVISVEEIRRFDQVIDKTIAASVARFAQVRERTLQALDRVSSAALGTGELDTFLPQLMSVLLESIVAVDSVAILLRDEQDVLQVRASIGLEEEVSRGYSVRVGQGFSGTVAARREPLLLRDASTAPLVLSPTIRRQGIHALYGVPLLQEGRVIGVAHMGSRTAYDFSEDDQQLLRTMAQRATSLIVQAQLTERLRRSEALLHAIVDHAPAAIYVKDTEGRYQLVNRYLEGLLQRPRQELLGKGDAELWPEDVARILRARDLQVMEGGVPVTDEEIVPGEEGPHTYLSVKFPLPDRSGHPEVLCGISMDITERKRMEAALRRDIRRREEAEHAQALLIEAGTVLAQSLDVETTLRSIASLAVEHLADYCLVDLLGEDGQLHRLEVLAREPARRELIRQIMAYPPRLGSSSPLARVFETGTPAVVDITPEWLEAATRSPEHRAVLEQLAPRSAVIMPLVAQGRSLGLITLASTEPGRLSQPSLVAVAQGVADRAATAIDNARLYQEAREAMRVREDVVAIVSHDLRNPLNAISLSAATLIKREELDARTAKAATRIYAAADRAHRLIRDLLDFTQARVGGIPLSPRPLEPGELARQVVEEVRSAWPERRIELQVGTGCQVEGDPGRLAQVLANLVGNAVQHSPADTPVRVALREEGEALLLEVHNEGAPIPAERLPGLFEPFQRGRGARPGAAGSLGLGLFISRQIVQAHGGRIDVRSLEGEGTTFTVRLPRLPRH